MRFCGTENRVFHCKITGNSAKMLKFSPAAPPEKTLQDSQKGAKQGGDFLQEIVLMSCFRKPESNHVSYDIPVKHVTNRANNAGIPTYHRRGSGHSHLLSLPVSSMPKSYGIKVLMMVQVKRNSIWHHGGKIIKFLLLIMKVR